MGNAGRWRRYRRACRLNEKPGGVAVGAADDAPSVGAIWLPRGAIHVVLSRLQVLAGGHDVPPFFARSAIAAISTANSSRVMTSGSPRSHFTINRSMSGVSQS